MELLHSRCCGLDVHKDLVVACVRLTDESGGVAEEVRTFTTTTRGILELGDWLAARGVTIAAMESTGVYWKPIWHVLEGRLKLMLVNARQVKQVPGHKTDVKDCQWIAQLLSYGLLRASFVPERVQQELRDLTRQRVQLIQGRAQVANRIQKLLEDANIKLGSVASDVLGKSGRDMLDALVEGKLSPEAMAQMARYRLRAKIPQLTEALHGSFNDHHRFLLKSLLRQVDHLGQEIDGFDARVEEVMPPLARAAAERLDEIPGFDRRAAQNVLAEIGWDMSRFPDSAHLASWAGVCPGNNQSAGKRRSGRVTEGNRWLKRTLCQCAYAASRCKSSYFRAQHRRLASRRGYKRATLAVAHSLLCVAYELLKHDAPFKDLGLDYFEKHDADRVKRQAIARLERLGYRVILESDAA